MGADKKKSIYLILICDKDVTVCHKMEGVEADVELLQEIAVVSGLSITPVPLPAGKAEEDAVVAQTLSPIRKSLSATTNLDKNVNIHEVVTAINDSGRLGEKNLSTTTKRKIKSMIASFKKKHEKDEGILVEEGLNEDGVKTVIAHVGTLDWEGVRDAEKYMFKLIIEKTEEMILGNRRIEEKLD